MASEEKKEKGYTLSIPVAVLLGLLAVGVLVGVGLLVWYKAPRVDCPEKTEQQVCDKYLKLYGKDPICKVPPKKEDEIGKKDVKVTGLRLNDTLVPSHYQVELWPRLFGDFGFNGTVTMLFTCMTETDVVVLHIDDITVHNDSIQLSNTLTGERVTYTSTEEDQPRQFYKIFLDKALTPSQNYSVSMTFNGTLIHPDWRGFYRSSYKENNQIHWLASTQFQRTHARRAFPCLDEPALKATFDITLVRLHNYSSISNMPRERSEPRGTDWVADVYGRTVVMPTYLLAFVISQFQYVESIGPKGLPLRIWTRPSFTKYAEFSSNYTGPFINAFEEWTGIPYALPKLDQVAVPDFAAGAMENWGLITYRETALLYNPMYTTNAERRWVASVVAHELAHQWFGNLITCYWWDDTFLNEGFATYFGDNVAMEKVMPEYEMDEFFLRRVFYIMDKDGNAKSQPVYVANLEHHDDLTKAFDIITYYKGGSILRMIKYFLTENTFRAGIQAYLKKYEYRTVVHDDLYRELEKQANIENSVTWDPMRTNLSRILDTWIEQQNYPIIHASDPVDGKVNFTQSHFLYDKDAEIATPTTIGPEFIWDVPLTIATKQQLANGARPHVTPVWMYREKEINVPLNIGAGGWFLVNLYYQGYYRVKYGQNNWNAIMKQLWTDHTEIPVENRAGLLDDAFRLAQADEMSEVEALRATYYISKETEYLPIRNALLTRLGYYLNMFYGTRVYDLLETYMRKLVVPIYNRFGWTVEQDNGEAHLDRYTRSIAISQACFRDYKPCVDKAKDLYAQFMANPNYDPIHPDLRYGVYCTAISRGGISEWDFLVSQYERDYGDVYIAYYNGTLEDAFSCVSSPHVIRKALDYALSKNSSTLFNDVASNRRSRDVAWNYITENWDHFKDGNDTRIDQKGALIAATTTWSAESDFLKLDSFIASHPDPALNSTYEAIKKSIRKNIEWLEVNMDSIEEYLLQANAGNLTMVTGSTQVRRRRRSLATDIEAHRPAFADVHFRSEL